MFQFDADLQSLDTGVWTTFLESKFKIAHISNIRFQRLLAKYQQPHRQKIERGSLDPQTSKDLLCRAMSEGILLDWENVVDGENKPVTYSPQSGFVALTKNVEFREFVTDFATNLANYRDEEALDLGKV